VSQFSYDNPNNYTVALDIHSLVIFIGVACCACSSRHARPCWGAYFGTGSPYNKHDRIGAYSFLSFPRADLEGVSQALGQIDRIDAAGEHIFDKIVIASNSEVLINDSK
jgi:hypothetical protein